MDARFVIPCHPDMDAQYPFASRDDIWRVFEELKDLQAAQFEQGERIARLERRRDEDARLRSVWGPLSPFPSSVGAVAAGMCSLLLLAWDRWVVLTGPQNQRSTPPPTLSRASIKARVTLSLPWDWRARKNRGVGRPGRTVCGSTRARIMGIMGRPVDRVASFR